MIDELQGIKRLYQYHKLLTEKSIAQLTDKQLRETIDGFDHSPSILMKHISGYLNSLWTNFRTEDGEKSWRNREMEFIDTFKSREEVVQYWERGWKTVFDAIESIKPGEQNQIIYIRNEGHTVMEALVRSLTHVAYHTGQIVQISKSLAGSKWKALSIPKGKTDDYNKKMFKKEKSTGFYKDRF